MADRLRHMLRDDDLSHDEQAAVLKLGLAFRQDRYLARPFEGPQAVAVIFDKPSTRTRSSFSVGRSEERRVGKECRSRWAAVH